MPSTPLTSLTIEFWWSWDSGTNLAYMYYHGTTAFRAFTNGVAYSGIMVRAIPGGTDITYAPSVQDGVWKHIAVVLNAATSQGILYVNGVSAGTSAYSGSITLDSTLYVLGQSSSNGAQVNYDRYRVWSRALNATEIANIVAGLM
jgi:hypothetical protein